MVARRTSWRRYQQWQHYRWENQIFACVHASLWMQICIYFIIFLKIETRGHIVLWMTSYTGFKTPSRSSSLFMQTFCMCFRRDKFVHHSFSFFGAIIFYTFPSCFAQWPLSKVERLAMRPIFSVKAVLPPLISISHCLPPTPIPIDYAIIFVFAVFKLYYHICFVQVSSLPSWEVCNVKVSLLSSLHPREREREREHMFHCRMYYEVSKRYFCVQMTTCWSPASGLPQSTQ